MTWTHNFTWFYKLILILGLPIVNFYHGLCENYFLNVIAEDASGLEWLGNQVLTPYHYLFVSRLAMPTGDEKNPYEFYQKFEYKKDWKNQTILSILLLPHSVLWGSLLKGIALFSEESYLRLLKMKQSESCTIVKNNNSLYRKIGLEINDKISIGEQAPKCSFQRRDGDENHLANDKLVLKEIIKLLEEENIPYWADCGTCLGAYRYEGVIPWDNDIDIAILEPDSDNVKRALNRLDRSKFLVWDWSSRDKPKTFLKVNLKGTDVLVDIYHYQIDYQNKTLIYVVSNENNIFMTEEWKKRERKYTIPVPFDMIFPLKRALLDGINVAVPNQMIEYLKVRYGENLDPLMKYNPEKNKYEKDEAHPYWKFLGSFFPFMKNKVNTKKDKALIIA